jgi:osmotically-inducible protein OsmY
MHIRTFITGAAVGAVAAYLFDPDGGNGRRARLRDQTGAMVRRSRERADDLSRHTANVMIGKAQELASPMRDREMDDATVADRIRSEVLGRRDLEASGVVVNVEDGVAKLRGTVVRPDLIEEMERRTRAVAGVRDVESMLHTSATPAPNKQASRSARRGPAAS